MESLQESWGCSTHANMSSHRTHLFSMMATTSSNLVGVRLLFLRISMVVLYCFFASTMLSVGNHQHNLESPFGPHLTPPFATQQQRQVVASIAAASIPAASIVWLYNQVKQSNTYSLWGSNPRPMAHKTIALTTELREHSCRTCMILLAKVAVLFA